MARGDFLRRMRMIFFRQSAHALADHPLEQRGRQRR
jgi:hypothetical protein